MAGRRGPTRGYGAGAGFRNAMRLYPPDGLGMVVMVNTTRPYDVHALFETVRRVVGREH